MDQLTTDPAALPGAAIGFVLLAVALGWNFTPSRARTKYKAARLGLAALGIGTVACTLGGYASSLLPGLG